MSVKFGPAGRAIGEDNYMRTSVMLMVVTYDLF